MIGQQGWVVSFRVEGTGHDDIEQRVLERLHTFWPPDESSGWRMDVDAYPREVVASGDGRTSLATSWTAEVKAQRVVVHSPTEHEAKS